MLIDQLLIVISIFVSIICCVYFIYTVLALKPGTVKMIEIANTIELCAKVYLKRQYFTILIVSLIISIIIFILFDKFYVLGFIIGAFLSGVSGYIGMLISVKANVRTTNAIRLYGLEHGLKVAFKSGGITGLIVINFSLLGVFLFYYILTMLGLDNKIIFNSLLSLGFGASLISIFARIGGGIFTKSADIGADLVGKLELGIPEDDYRNPAAIADNVGDNVGDCAGMAADLYETCCVTNIATMVLINIMFDSYLSAEFILFPLVLTALAIFATILGIIFIKLINNNVMLSLYRCLGIVTILFVLFLIIYISLRFGWNYNFNYAIYSITIKHIFYCCLCGIFLTLIIVLITEYYTSTSYLPVRSIAAISNKGHAPNIIQGLAISMESTVLPVCMIVVTILISYYFAGIIGLAIATTSMVSLSGIIITLDAYGPITDNAGGIAEMAKLSNEIRQKTDILDSVGNTTKAITKGYAISSAALGSLILFITYTEDLHYYFNNINLTFSLTDPFVIIGLFLGGIIPYLFSSFSMKSVGVVSSKVVHEIRLQFENFDVQDSNFKPNYKKVVDLLTKESIKEMIVPSLLPILLPVLFYCIIFIFFGKYSAFIVLGSMLLGVIVIGVFLAISMTSGGGAWDNAKKYIENGNYGGKNSLAHSAAITGDMVGDPYKDTAGPAINPLIKVINLTALLIVIFVSKF